MGSDSTRLVVRFRPEAHEEFRAKAIPVLRGQAISLIALGFALAIPMIAAPLFVYVVERELVTWKDFLLLIVLAVLPVWVVVLGARQLRRTPSLPDVALTVTDDHVVLGPMDRMTLFGRWRPELRWGRRSTEADFVAGNGLFTQDRIKFTSRDGRKRRKQYLLLPKLDASADEILAAVRRP